MHQFDFKLTPEAIHAVVDPNVPVMVGIGCSDFSVVKSSFITFTNVVWSPQ
jgi:hypothetical protein